MCFENALEMLWKCANVRMCKCENEKECFSLTFVASYITKHGKTLAYLHILTFAHSHICAFLHLHISQAFAHSHILTFAHFPSIYTFLKHLHILTSSHLHISQALALWIH